MLYCLGHSLYMYKYYGTIAISCLYIYIQDIIHPAAVAVAVLHVDLEGVQLGIFWLHFWCSIISWEGLPNQTKADIWKCMYVRVWYLSLHL